MNDDAVPHLPTSLGPQLRRAGDVWALDLGDVPILHGLSVLARALAEIAGGQLRSERPDLVVERKLRPQENPELRERFRIDHVRLVAERDAAEAAGVGTDEFERRLRALLGSLQRRKYRTALLAEDGAPSRALTAAFGAGAERVRFLLERVGWSRAEGSPHAALRIVVERAEGRRLDLSSVPHVPIADVEDRRFIAGSTRIAQTWADAARREAERGRRSFFELRHPHSHLFRQLDQAGLSSVTKASVQWGEADVPFLLDTEPTAVAAVLKRALLALEDREVRRLLAAREVVRVEGGELPVHLDLAQAGRVLEVALGEPRRRVDVGAFLDRMPALRAVVARAGGAALRGVRVFLVHHLTGEVLGLIAALRELGCRDLRVLFVSYAGEPPASYLDALLDLPEDEVRTLGLVNVPAPDAVEGRYRPSAQFSRLDEADDLARAVAARDGGYLEAMRAAAVVAFLRQLAGAEAAGEPLLVVEDGGYLGPALNDATLRGATVAAFAAEHGDVVADPRPLTEVLRGRWLGVVEHTRNGYDRLAEVERRHGALARPAFSIAVSRLKRDVESREIAASILSAVETVLNADGLTLARRSALVLGSRGAIGRELVRHLRLRLDRAEERLCGVDLVAAAGAAAGFAEAPTLAALGRERWLATELVLGVTGVSLVSGEDVAERLVHGAPGPLILASGSTKKVEFKDVMRWLDDLRRSPEPRLVGRRATFSAEELLDPRTARVYGHRYAFRVEGVDGVRTLLALANLTPINFLFYGAATELIDEVLAQLASVALGLVRRAAGPPPAPRLCAVDVEIDADGNPLPRG